MTDSYRLNTKIVVITFFQCIPLFTANQDTKVILSNKLYLHLNLYNRSESNSRDIIYKKKLTNQFMCTFTQQLNRSAIMQIKKEIEYILQEKGCHTSNTVNSHPTTYR